MKISDFDYHLPIELIAQETAKPRDHSRLLVVPKKTDSGANPAPRVRIEKPRKPSHHYFYEIADFLKPGDILILNNSKVFPARLIGKKSVSGGKVEVFLVRKMEKVLAGEESAHFKINEEWQCLIGGRINKDNRRIDFDHGLKAMVLSDNQDGTWQVGFNKKGKAMMDIVYKIGLMPLPPYIKKSKIRDNGSAVDYQTAYADDRKVGSVAAPTAGLHFTPALLKKIKDKGVRIEYVTLHVGLGTFAPVKVEDITKHKMHAEWVEVRISTIKNILKAKRAGRRVIGVGTTSVRTIEAMARELGIGSVGPESIDTPFPEIKRQNGLFSKFADTPITSYQAFVDIFIYPGYKFKLIDGMVTNFHLPKSTLIMLVSALAGRKRILKAYQEAIENKYRFYSYGDAMLII